MLRADIREGVISVRLKIQRVACFQGDDVGADDGLQAPVQHIDVFFNAAAMNAELACRSARRKRVEEPVDAAAGKNRGDAAAQETGRLVSQDRLTRGLDEDHLLLERLGHKLREGQSQSLG